MRRVAPASPLTGEGVRVCKRNHPQTPENVIANSDGKRRCRPCAQLRRRRQHEKVKRPCPKCGRPMTHTSAQCQACRTTDIETRFLSYVEKTSDCWLWHGHRDAKGYGRFLIAKAKTDRAHRVAYRLWIGPIPRGADVHHTCENEACVRPSHLQPLAPAAHARHHLLKRYRT